MMSDVCETKETDTTQFTMGPPAVGMVYIVALCLTVTLLAGPRMVHAEDSHEPEEEPVNRNTMRDLYDTRFDALDGRVNRINSRLDGMETAISDMKDFLQKQMEAMDEKVEWALTGVKPRQDVHSGEVKQVSYLLPLVRGDFRPLRAPEVHESCEEARRRGWTTSGIYQIRPDNNTTLDVLCEQQLDGGGWTVFQARKDGSVDFYRDWNTYAQGFGELTGEFWLGNTNIHRLTKHNDHQLKVELVSNEGEVEFAEYSHFSIADEANKFRLTATGYSGGTPPGNSLSHHNGRNFSTHDQDNDSNGISCARVYVGAWWYGSCHNSNLNGLYGSTDPGRGLTWEHWKGNRASMKATGMMIRKRP